MPYNLLNIKPSDVPQCIGHVMGAIQGLASSFICSFVAIRCRGPNTASAHLEERFASLVPISAAQNRGLNWAPELGRKILRYMQRFLWAGAEFAWLGAFTTVGFKLWRISEATAEQHAAPSPETVGPLPDLDILTQVIPTLQHRRQTLMNEFCAAARGAIGARMSQTPAPSAFFLSKTGIIPTTNQFQGSSCTTSWMQPRDTARDRHSKWETYIYILIHTDTDISYLDKIFHEKWYWGKL